MRKNLRKRENVIIFAGKTPRLMRQSNQIEATAATGGCAEQNVKQAFSRLASLCARREYCQHDMQEKMRQWGVPEEEQAQVMQQLTEGRYVDDERFARAFVDDKVRYGKWGRRKIEQALWMKRIDEGIAGSVLDEVDDEEYLAVLRPQVKQKLSTTHAASDYELRMKVTKWAIGRGYTMDLIRQCLDTPEVPDFP